MPWCSQRGSGPSFSPTQVRKAITSCLVTASIASIAGDVDLAEHVGVIGLADGRGVLGRDHADLPIASAANTSISNQMR